MSRKGKAFTIFENVEIEDIAAEGKAVARIEDMVVFVPFVVPGDIVDLRVTRKKHRYAEAVAIHFHKYSDRKALLPPLHGVRRMQVAMLAVRRAAAAQAATGDGHPDPHWQGRPT